MLIIEQYESPSTTQQQAAFHAKLTPCPRPSSLCSNCINAHATTGQVQPACLMTQHASIEHCSWPIDAQWAAKALSTPPSPTHTSRSRDTLAGGAPAASWHTDVGIPSAQDIIILCSLTRDADASMQLPLELVLSPEAAHQCRPHCKAATLTARQKKHSLASPAPPSTVRPSQGQGAMTRKSNPSTRDCII